MGNEPKSAYDAVVKERDELARWKKEALATFEPILRFEHPELKLGESRVAFLLLLSKERDQLKAALV